MDVRPIGKEFQRIAPAARRGRGVIGTRRRRGIRAAPPSDRRARNLPAPRANRKRAAQLNSRAIVLHRHGRIVIMDTCKLFSRRRVATTACAVLPTPGIVG
jgi:hypothetical protein